MPTVVPVYVNSDTSSSTTGTTIPVDYPAHSVGDLVIQCFTTAPSSGSARVITPPATGPNGATVLTVASFQSGINLQTFAVWAWIATSSPAAGSVNATISFASPTTSGCVVFDAGTFNPADPFGDETPGYASTAATATISSWATVGVDKIPVAFVGINDDDLTAGAPSGWTNALVSVVATGDQCGLAVYTRDAETTTDETIAATNFGSWGSTPWVATGVAVNPQTLVGTQSVLGVAVSIPASTRTSSTNPTPTALTAAVSFPTGFQVFANNTVINATTIEIATEIPAFVVLGNASVFPRVVTTRVEMPRPIEFRLSPTNAARGRNDGGYEPKASPAERRAQFDIKRKVRDLEP